MTDLADHWDNVYSTKPPDAVTWYQEVPATSLDLLGATGLGTKDRIVDVGAGAATLVDHLLGLGYTDVVLTDISAVALEVTRQRLGERSAVRYIVGNLFDMDIGQVDMWHDRAVFHFLTDSEERLRYKAVMALHVRPGGHAIVATFASDGPERCSGLPVTRHSPLEMADFFGPQFSFVDSRREIHVAPSGDEQPFSFALLHREASPLTSEA